MDQRKELFVILNELIGLMSRQVMVEVVSSIHNANWYALIDKATDISYKEQLCPIIRWEDNDFNIFDDSIELIDILKTDYETITIFLKDCLTKISFP